MSFEQAVALVRTGQRFLVTCHRRPDADALGSALGFARALRAIGKEAEVFVPEPLMQTVRFLTVPGEIVDHLDPNARFDATFCMDTAAKSLLPFGLPTIEERGPLVIVDHHAAHDDVGDIVVRDTSACATGEIIVRFCDAFGIAPLTREIAAPVYAAIVADTGGFRYSATRPDTLRIGARLLEAGVDPWETAYHLFEGWEAERLRLLGAVLETLETHCDGKLALLRVTRAMLEECHATDDMVEGMVNYGRMLQGVEIAVLLWEFAVDDGGKRRLDVKVSLRTRGLVDVSRIAIALNGGGHRAAAGAQVTSDLATVADIVVREANVLLLEAGRG